MLLRRSLDKTSKESNGLALKFLSTPDILPFTDPSTRDQQVRMSAKMGTLFSGIAGLFYHLVGEIDCGSKDIIRLRQPPQESKRCAENAERPDNRGQSISSSGVTEGLKLLNRLFSRTERFNKSAHFQISICQIETRVSVR
ncbi:hypothetical protein C5F51_29410 [Nocardia nova]|uniref:Uncharacterized protein n=1 Tax=Nocardia nova TaxID=37330 RepID=A0A2S5ZYF7_9NOCA|nr:hypothetical protein C5F51_29410 [Nocardia nova]